MWEPITESSEALICKDEINDMFKEPKRAELQKWKDMDVYSEVENTGQQSITTRWVCTERMKAGKIEAKARLCARGCEDVEDVPTDSPTCERDNVRLMLSIAMSRGWSIHSVDIKSAYLQGETVDRDIFLVPPKEANTQKLWKLKKCVYGINDAGRKWYNQFRKDLLNFGAQISKLDQAVFFKHDNGQLSGIMVLHIDDTLWAGNELFASQIIKPLKEKFSVSAEEHNNMTYLGLSIKSNIGSAKLDLDHYVQRLQEIQISPDRNSDDTLTGKETNQLRVLSGQLNWLSAQSRPDVSFNSCQIACSIKNAKVSDIKYANKAVRKVKGSNYHLTYLPLGTPELWKIISFSDASWGNLPDGGSQGAYLIFLVGEGGTANLISWQSRRVRRVARSTIAAETLAAMDACESASLLSSQISEIMNIAPIPVTLLTDNESLTNSVLSTKSVEEKRLRVDISALREMVNRKEIESIRWISTDDQLADCLTKQGAKVECLLAVIKQQLRFEQSRLQFMPPRHE